MDKHTSLLMLTFIGGLFLGTGLALLPEILSSGTTTLLVCAHIDCMPDTTFLHSLLTLILSTVVVAFLTLWLARAIHWLFFIAD